MERSALMAERLRRYVQVVLTTGGVGSIPTQCNLYVEIQNHDAKKSQIRAIGLGMILASGARGHGFDSRIAPFAGSQEIGTKKKTP
jgi:hypothetical protein